MLFFTISDTEGSSVEKEAACFTQLTDLGEVEIGALYTDKVRGVLIDLKDPRLLTDDWATPVQILQDQWQSYRQRPAYRGERLFGIITTDDICRLYSEPLTEGGRPVLFEYGGRSEFVPPTVFLKDITPALVKKEIERASKAGGHTEDHDTETDTSMLDAPSSPSPYRDDIEALTVFGQRFQCLGTPRTRV